MTHIDHLSMLIGFGIGLLTAFLCMIVYKWASHLMDEPKEEKKPLRDIHYFPPPPTGTERITNAISNVSAQSSYLRKLVGTEFHNSSFYQDVCLSLAIIIDDAVKDLNVCMQEKWNEEEDGSVTVKGEDLIKQIHDLTKQK